MRISSKAHYGLQAAYILARENRSVSAKELEREIGVSGKYLERIMRILTGANVIAASRGAAGGYYLAKTAKQTTVGEIVRALEDDLEIIDCVKNDGCVKCASNVVWKKLYNGINEILNSVTLEDMVNENAVPLKKQCECSCKECEHGSICKRNA